MFDEQRSVALASVNPDGAIHAVAMFAVAHEGRIVFLTKEKSQKVRNIGRDPRVTVVAATTAGRIQVRGRAEIVTDMERLIPLGRRFLARRPGPAPVTDQDLMRVLHKRVAIVVKPVHTVTWPAWMC